MSESKLDVENNMYNQSLLASRTKKLIANSYLLFALLLLTTPIGGYFVQFFTLTFWSVLGCVLISFILLIGLFFAKSTSYKLISSVLFAFSMGVFIGEVFKHEYIEYAYTIPIATNALLFTCLEFIVLSFYVFSTKRNFDSWGDYLIAWSLTLIVSMLLMMIVQFVYGMKFEFLQFVISIVISIVFVGFILHDTSKIVRGQYDNFVEAGVDLYLDFLNAFVNLYEILKYLNK